MKSLFPYLILGVLFIIGTRLVNRQREYTRSIQASIPPEKHVIVAGQNKLYTDLSLNQSDTYASSKTFSAAGSNAN